MQSKENLYILVSYAGALPLIACAMMLYSGVEAVEGFGSVSHIIAILALVIVSFIAGVHFGTYLFYHTQTPKSFLIISNIIAAVAWLLVLMSSLKLALSVLILAFVYLLFVDYLLKREGFISHNYFNTRFVVTLITTGSLLITTSIA